MCFNLFMQVALSILTPRLYLQILGPEASNSANESSRQKRIGEQRRIIVHGRASDEVTVGDVLLVMPLRPLILLTQIYHKPHALAVDEVHHVGLFPLIDLAD